MLAARSSIETALRTRKLAREIGVNRIAAVGNRVRAESDKRLIEEGVQGIEVIGFFSYHPEIARADREGKTVLGASPLARKEAGLIAERLSAVAVGHQQASVIKPEKMRG